MGYFGNPYQMGYNPYSGYAPASPQNGAGAMQGFAGQITRVNGENGVDALRMAPRSELIAMDISRSDVLIGWYVKTDDAGYKSKPTQSTASLTSIEERLTRLEGIVNEQSVAGKPDGKPKGGKTE